MNDILISIIMPVYNSEEYLEKAIQSILVQTHSNWELLIVDDASTDQSKMKLKKYTDKRIKIIENTVNLGIAQSRNKALNIAKGQYIAFLDSDDWWLPEKLSFQLDIMKKENVKFCCTSYYVCNEAGNIINERNFKSGFKGYKQLLKTNFIGCLTVLIEATVAKQSPMPNLKHEDYATWLNIMKSGIDVYILEEKLAVYRKNDASRSGNKWNTILWVWKIFRENEKLSLIKSVTYLLRFLFFTTFKYMVNE